MTKTRFEELKFKQPEAPSVLPTKGVERRSKKLKANHTSLPIIEGNEYSLVSEGKDYYNVKCRGQSMHVAKWVFDTPPKQIPRWILQQKEDFEELNDE